MAEAGVDISGQRSKHVGELQEVDFDYVVTVCDHAHESCPLFPGKAKVVHVGFDDPPLLAADAGTEEERLAPYRRVRDEIKLFVLGLPSRWHQWIASRLRGPIRRRIQLHPQAIFSVYAEHLGLDRDTALRIAAAFGGGMGPHGLHLRRRHRGLPGLGTTA